MSQGLEEIGITGYPESHPFIGDDTTIHAMFDKAPLRRTVRTTPPMAPHVGRAAGALSRRSPAGARARVALGVGRGGLRPSLLGSLGVWWFGFRVTRRKASWH